MSIPASRPPLRRGLDTPVAGVCLGLARHLGVSVPVMRTVMIALTVAGGIGLILYCWLWAFVPVETEPEPEAARRGLSGPAVESPDAGTHTSDAGFDAASAASGTGPGEEDVSARLRRGLDVITRSPEVLAGGLLLGIAGIMMLQLVGIRVDWWLIGPPAILVVGLLLAWSQVDAGEGAGTTRSRQSVLWQFAAGTFLVLVALLVMAGGFVPAGELILSLVLAGMLLAGVALVIAPWLIKMYRTMSVERARAVAEAERADIAAHLHDSVLQTLAMIQKQRHDPAAVGQLARSQERQLRDWLYRQQEARGQGPSRQGAGAQGSQPGADGVGQQPQSLREKLMAAAAELEELYTVPVEVVTVGESHREDHEALVAAAREAIVNALKHAGPASVYAESDAREDAVFIRDRGQGFDVDAIEEDRLGVRESIIGRMRRAGGRARIRSSESGTEVQLFLPAEARVQEETES
ncbi:ATP-binding protein [Nesterenkonia cremea]|uniref:Histidine kinase n=1 Tax=Nesterenkonia cremea TaxID=1882340 RepID=A0A917ER61_9MICC|nr:ATP-binding protein [Nesterenkonia cremea]GGE69405.1 histidine kinase [Nesterenkonia cremea]